MVAPRSLYTSPTLTVVGLSPLSVIVGGVDEHCRRNRNRRSQNHRSPAPKVVGSSCCALVTQVLSPELVGEAQLLRIDRGRIDGSGGQGLREYSFDAVACIAEPAGDLIFNRRPEARRKGLRCGRASRGRRGDGLEIEVELLDGRHRWGNKTLVVEHIRTASGVQVVVAIDSVTSFGEDLLHVLGKEADVLGVSAVGLQCIGQRRE